MLREIALGDEKTVDLALAHDVDRIELNTNLSVGGLTPPEQLITYALDAARDRGIPVVVMVRPRAGDFVYSYAEVEEMLQTLKKLRGLGVKCVTFGAVTAEGRLDRETMLKLIEAAQPMQVIFHMAFDDIVTECQEQAMQWLSNYHVMRILTHGGPITADIEETLPHLKWLCEMAPDGLTILPGGGVNYQNAEAISQVLAVDELHGSKIIDTTNTILA